MKIIDLLKVHHSEEEISKVIDNIKEFDLTKLDVEEIFEALQPTFIKRENWETFGPVSACEGVNRSIAKIQKLEDGKFYPYISMEIIISSCGMPDSVILEFTPFCCDEARGGCARYDLKRNLTKAFKKFMVGKFGSVYVERNNAYYTTAKEKEIQLALDEATDRIESAKLECDENII